MVLRTNGPFAAEQSRGTKIAILESKWRTGTCWTKKIQIWWLSLTSPSASFALQYGDLYHVIAQLQKAYSTTSEIEGKKKEQELKENLKVKRKHLSRPYYLYFYFFIFFSSLFSAYGNNKTKRCQ